MNASRVSIASALSLAGAILLTVVAARVAARSGPAFDESASAATAAQADIVLKGRQLVISHGCGQCHGGGDDPGEGHAAPCARSQARQRCQPSAADAAS